ncbi:MAG: ATP-binding protein, partial [Gaiellaceae bacterium]
DAHPERRALVDRERAGARIRFLSRASELLNLSLDLERTLGALAELAVPRFAGHVTVDLIEDGVLRCVGARHVDPAKTELMTSLRTQYPPTVETHPVQRALRSGEAQLVRDVQAEAESMAHDERHARAIHELANTSGIVVPLIARGRTFGAITFGTVPPQERFGDADLETAKELGRRASTALDNALLHREVEGRAHAAQALEFVDDGVFLLDRGGAIRLWNPAAEKAFGTKARKAIGRRMDDLVADWTTLRERIRVTPAHSTRAARATLLPVVVHGEERWLSISGVRFPGGTVYAFRDMTEERAVEQLKSDFVSTVSHELRTPLAAIYGAALTLQRDDVRLEDSQRSGLLDVISAEADRLARIVNDILWASRLDSGQMAVAIESCDAAALARQVVQALRSHAPENVTVELEAEEGLPAVAADPDKLRQVLTNLIDNAVKYSPDGGKVTVVLQAVGQRVRLRVEDDGLGIPPAEQDRIWEKFFRLDPQLTRGVGGTGLGLYIVRELVHRMDGRIWVVSDGCSGSTFTVELPIAAA